MKIQKQSLNEFVGVLQLIFYVVAGGALIFLVYKAYGLIKSLFGNSPGTVGGLLNQAAENYGYSQATAAEAPQLNYDQARSAWMKAYGISPAQALNSPGFVTEEQWANGEKFTDPAASTGSTSS